MSVFSTHLVSVDFIYELSRSNKGYEVSPLSIISTGFKTVQLLQDWWKNISPLFPHTIPVKMPYLSIVW
jgi:hypothetical protein